MTSLQEITSLPDDAMLTVPEVLTLLNISRSSLYRGVKDGLIPEPKKYGKRMARWRLGEIRKLTN